MTVTDDPVRAAPTPSPAPPPAATPSAPSGTSTWVTAVFFTVCVLLTLVIGFLTFLFGFSGIAQARHQNTMYKTFSHQLSQALAPVGSTTPGAPIAVLTVPRMGLQNEVVVDGTTSADLTAGPGHLQSTPLPGQAGTSILFGRRTTYGGPFAHLLDLRVGDTITVTTGQGVAHYRVTSFGTSQHPAPANSANRLELLTATGPWNSTSYASVSADLIGKPQPSTGNLPQITVAATAMQADPDDAIVPLLLWGQAMLLVAGAATVGFYRWSRAATLVCLVPIALAVVWNLYENFSLLLTNLF